MVVLFTVIILQPAFSDINAVLKDSSVRMRDKPTTINSRTVGSLNKGDRVIILGKSRNEEKIGSMTAHWYRIKTENGTIGYSYGYFFDADSLELKSVPTFYINSQYDFSLLFPATWKDWISSEQLINYGFGVSPVPAVYFGLPDQNEIFVVVIYTTEQWDQLLQVEPPDGVSGEPFRQNSHYMFDYSLGHYEANDEMHKRRGDVGDIMKTIEITEDSSN